MSNPFHPQSPNVTVSSRRTLPVPPSGGQKNPFKGNQSPAPRSSSDNERRVSPSQEFTAALHRGMAEANVQRPSEAAVAHNLQGVNDLAGRGAWIAVLALTAQLSITESALKPDEVYLLRLARLRANFQLSRHTVAATDLASFGDLNSPNTLFDNQVGLYAGRRGSMIPFGLRVLAAELPHYLGQTLTAIDKLFELYHICCNQADRIKSFMTSNQLTAEPLDDTQSFLHDIDYLPTLRPSGPSLTSLMSFDLTADPVMESADTPQGVPCLAPSTMFQRWQSRCVRLGAAIAILISQLQFPSTSIELMHKLNERAPQDRSILFHIIRMQVEAGSISAADVFFQKHIYHLADSFYKFMSSGYMLSKSRRHREAVVHFSKARELGPESTTAVAYLAQARLDSGDMAGAMNLAHSHILENMKLNFNQLLSEVLIKIYDKASDKPSDSKRALTNYICNVMPEGFIAS